MKKFAIHNDFPHYLDCYSSKATMATNFSRIIATIKVFCYPLNIVKDSLKRIK